MKNTLLKTLTLALLLTGSAVQAVSNDELYMYAEKALRYIPAAEEEDANSIANREQYISTLDLSAEKVIALQRYIDGIQAVEEELRANNWRNWLSLLVGGGVGSIASYASGNLMNKRLNHLVQANRVTGIITLLLSLFGGIIGKQKLETKTARLKRLTVDAWVEKSDSFTRTLAALKWWHGAKRFVYGALAGSGAVGASRLGL